jgi:hypothetical protein
VTDTLALRNDSATRAEIVGFVDTMRDERPPVEAKSSARA